MGTALILAPRVSEDLMLTRVDIEDDMYIQKVRDFVVDLYQRNLKPIMVQEIPLLLTCRVVIRIHCIRETTQTGLVPPFGRDS